MNYLVLGLTIFCSALLRAQPESIFLYPNNGQWEEQVEYTIDLFGGKMYVENESFLFHFYESPKSHNHSDEKHEEVPDVIKAHAVRTTFIGSSWNGNRREENPSSHYRNYFIGNNSSQWASNIHGFNKVELTNFYPNIDLQLDGKNGQLKYSFILQAHVDPSQIQMQIDGADRVFIDAEGNLNIHTSLGTIQEMKPVAWTEANGRITPVEVKFELTNSILSYVFPEGYNTNERLVIDPNLVFSTFTGSTTDNWGMTATPGPNGEMYAGGISFGAGYPVTAGAYDLTYNGGTANGNIPGFDIAISKFTDDGTQLLYSTYIGGASNELPESMITTTNGELYILGITGSSNFPMGPTPYDNSFGAGNANTSNSLVFPNGTDICLIKLSSNGTALLSSTYVGGSGNDGLNTSSLSYNYGDQYRGEIIIDGQENVIVSSHTQSSNFPKTNGSSLLGSQDMVVFKMQSDLSALIWSSYYGGTGAETGNSIALSSQNDIFVTGGSTSNDIFLIGNDPTINGGPDGLLLKLNGANGTLIAGTYMGGNEYDQTYFVKLDIDDEVYVYGQTETSWTITPGCYGNPGSGQFLRKYSNDLMTIDWTTMIGAGTGHPEISPTAFLISDCYDIFISGWGGQVNVSGSSAIHSSSNGFPITPDAYQPSTNGSNFYLGILGVDATSLIYGTYMGGVASSSNHVDGGTSRFDKSGAVYHAVCAACGSADNGFTTTPGVWSPTNPSNNCNLAAFKFQLGMPYSLSANSTVCNGEPVQLNASGGITYTWTPASSLNNPNISNPIATPTQTTVYYVSMDFNEGCAIVDSVVVEVISEPVVNLNASTNVCFGDTVTLNVSGGLTYSWSPNSNISSTTNASVQVWPTTSQYYYCDVSNECFTKRDSIFVNVIPLPEIILTTDTIICKGDDAIIQAIGGLQHSWTPHSTLTVLNNNQANVQPLVPMYYYATGIDANGCENRDSVFVSFYEIPELIISNDTTICFETSTQLSVSGAGNYTWTPSSSLVGANTATPVATPLIPTVYTVTGIYGMGCEVKDSVEIDLMYLPIPEVLDTIHLCVYTPTDIVANAIGADSYTWSPGTYLNTTVGQTVIATVENDITYEITFTNVCGSVTEEVTVDAIVPNTTAFNDTIVCPGNPAYLYAVGGIAFQWSPINGLNSTIASSVVATPNVPTMYTVVGTDIYGCKDRDSVFVDLFPQPYIKASPDVYLFEGETADLYATIHTPGQISWSPTEYLSCVNCDHTQATPPTDFQYFVSYVDENGCIDSDEVWVYFKPLIYVPNTFSPDGNEFNEYFKAKGGNVRNFQMRIFNRWGEVVCTLNDLSEWWDGTYKGNKCQDGTYTWKITYSDLRGNDFELTGHVNLIR